jgi:hypothetical protein
VTTGSVIIKNLNHGEQGETIFVGEPKNKLDSRYCLAMDHFKKNSDPTKDEGSRFFIEPCGGNFLIRNEKFNRYLYAGEPSLDANNRLVLAWDPDKKDGDKSYQWKIVNHGEYHSI